LLECTAAIFTRRVIFHDCNVMKYNIFMVSVLFDDTILPV